GGGGELLPGAAVAVPQPQLAGGRRVRAALRGAVEQGAVAAEDPSLRLAAVAGPGDEPGAGCGGAGGRLQALPAERGDAAFGGVAGPAHAVDRAGEAGDVELAEHILAECD